MLKLQVSFGRNSLAGLLAHVCLKKTFTKNEVSISRIDPAPYAPKLWALRKREIALIAEGGPSNDPQKEEYERLAEWLRTLSLLS